MKRYAFVLVFSALAMGSGFAQTAGTEAMQACESKAMSKDGKPLTGAARASAIRSCCDDAATSKEGKPLRGAAKSSFMLKCTSPLRPQ